MRSVQRAFRGLALLLVFGLFIGAAQALAIHEGLVRAYDSPDIFWVDRFGIRHHVVSPSVMKGLFGQSSAPEISWGEMVSMPEGGPLTFSRPPEFYDSRPDRVATVIRRVPVQRSVRIEREYGAPYIVRDEHIWHHPAADY